jgi:Cd2+/Zn2+-exporting ATPase
MPGVTVFPLGLKGLFLLLTLVGHASLWAGSAADTGASRLVILNGLRLLRTGEVGNQSKHAA